MFCDDMCRERLVDVLGGFVNWLNRIVLTTCVDGPVLLRRGIVSEYNGHAARHLNIQGMRSGKRHGH